MRGGRVPVPAARRKGCLVAEWKREWWRVWRWDVSGVDIVLLSLRELVVVVDIGGDVVFGGLR